MRTLLSCFPFYYYYLPFANKSHVLSGRLEPIDRVLFDVSGMGRMFGRRNRWPLMMFSSQMTCKKRKRTCLGGREGHPAWCPNKSRKPKTMVCRWEAEEGRGSGRAVFCVLRRCPCWSKRRWERHTEGRPILPWLRNAKFRTLAKMSSTKTHRLRQPHTELQMMAAKKGHSVTHRRARQPTSFLHFSANKF